MDYDKVNNPFITLKNHKTDEEFTVDLSKDLPYVDNDPAMSNMKKSNHALYSDNRAEKLRMGDDVNTLGNYAITLVDIDNIIYEYITKVINPQVIGSDRTIISVPVRHASPERWSAIQSDGVYRDDKGQLQRPMVIFSRTNVAKDDSFQTFNKYLTVPFVKKFSSKNSYDRMSVLNSAEPLMEVHNVTFPDHVVLTYDFNMSAEYVQQMNQLIEIFNFAEGDYWGDPKRFKFRASVDSFSNTVETPSDDDRVVTSTFSLTVNAYLLPMVFDNKTTVQRGLSTRKVLWGTEATSSAAGLSGKPPIGHSAEEMAMDLSIREASSETNFILNRKKPTAYLRKQDASRFVIRLWPDLEVYTINVDGRNFDITVSPDDRHFIWDYQSSEIEMTPGKTYNILLDDKTESYIKVEVKPGFAMIILEFV
tara:strand:+ start:1891 stop:3153 length:1263 start_codon:yes stop_codon:yes gene_type:complete